MASRPRMGDSFHRASYPPEARNGVVVKVRWQDQEVVVVYNNGDRETYSWDELEFHYTDRYGGVYMVNY